MSENNTKKSIELDKKILNTLRVPGIPVQSSLYKDDLVKKLEETVQFVSKELKDKTPHDAQKGIREAMNQYVQASLGEFFKVFQKYKPKTRQQFQNQRDFNNHQKKITDYYLKSLKLVKENFSHLLSDKKILDHYEANKFKKLSANGVDYEIDQKKLVAYYNLIAGMQQYSQEIQKKIKEKLEPDMKAFAQNKIDKEELLKKMEHSYGTILNNVMDEHSQTSLQRIGQHPYNPASMIGHHLYTMFYILYNKIMLEIDPKHRVLVQHEGSGQRPPVIMGGGK